LSLARSILIFFGAFVFSALLWAYVRLSAAYEADVDLPIKLSAPKGFALTSGLPERLHARVRGAGWQIILMSFTKNADFRFDLTDRSVQPATPLVLHSDEIANAAMLPSELRVMKVDPDSLQLQFGKAIEKRLTVVPQLDVVPAKGYTVVGEPQIAPRTVMVTGSQTILDSLNTIPTQVLVASDVKEDVESSLPLSDSLDNFLTIPSSKIAIHVAVQALGERRMTNIPVTVEALPPQFDVVLIPGAINVMVRGGVQDLAKLSSDAIHAHVSYTPFVFDTAHAVEPIVDLPKGLTFLSSEPSSLRFILRRKPEQPVLLKRPKHNVSP